MSIMFLQLFLFQPKRWHSFFSSLVSMVLLFSLMTIEGQLQWTWILWISRENKFRWIPVLFAIKTSSLFDCCDSKCWCRTTRCVPSKLIGIPFVPFHRYFVLKHFHQELWRPFSAFIYYHLPKHWTGETKRMACAYWISSDNKLFVLRPCLKI